MLSPEQQKEMYNIIKTLEPKVTRIETGVFGDERAGVKGIKDRVRDNEKYISTDKKIKWIGVGIGMAIGWLVKGWDKVSHAFDL